MQQLLEGAKRFSTQEFHNYEKIFKKICRKQTPHTLFIGCSDSRIMPNLLTGTLPGELFIIRNIANIVPYYRDTNDYVSTTSGIEYAVKVLKVSNIIVCGHSNCGGCCALFMDGKQLEDIPHTRKWLELSSLVRKSICDDHSLDSDEHRRDQTAEQMNVVEQINHLLTHPYVKEKYDRKEINILGWYYVIETGEIFNYHMDTQEFLKIE